jgi:1-deoxy-D-xylulose-5-phosphate synthase
VAECLAAAGVLRPLLQVGLPDRYVEHGSREDCLAMAGLDAASIETRVAEWWAGQAPIQAARARRSQSA